ncbi:MAG: family 20 glycosylhydrolase, partial [Pseudomonadota bacterium]
LEELVATAAELGIRIVPEIDMPGHVTSWLTAYPEWGGRQVAPTERFGVHGACLDPGNEAVYAAIGEILDAVVSVFPDSCLHIGGDEVSPRWWSEDPAVAALMEREGLNDVRAVQGYFNERVGAMVAERGRTVLAWDEVLDAGFGADWVIQAWRGSSMRDRITAAGNQAVVSAPYYLDLHFPVDVHYDFDPAAPQHTLLAREDALLSDPRFQHVSAGMRWTEQWREGMGNQEEVDTERLLGAEACLWSELVNAGNLTTRLWTRLPALAERFWSPAAGRVSAEVHERVDAFLERTAGLSSIDPLGSSAAALGHLGVSGAWLELLGWFEPVKWYGRLLGAEALAARIAGREMPQARPYTLASPLNGVVDHLPVESAAARRLGSLAPRAADDAEAGEQLAATLATLRRLASLPAHEAPEALPEVAELMARLLRLTEVVEARCTGQLLSVEALSELLSPVGELILAAPKPLCLWLVQP